MDLNFMDEIDELINNIRCSETTHFKQDGSCIGCKYCEEIKGKGKTIEACKIQTLNDDVIEMLQAFKTIVGQYNQDTEKENEKIISEFSINWDELNKEQMQSQVEALKNAVVGYRYRHFKGEIYIATNIAINSETAEPMVVYRTFSKPSQAWVRPLKMFLSEVDHEKYPEVTQKFRFERLEEME